MRQLLFVAGLLAGGTACAAPGPASPTTSADRNKLRAEYRSFARQLHLLVGQVGEKYVRPVSAQDLYIAALTELFLTARKAPPRDLRVQVRQAINLAAAIRARSSSELSWQAFSAGQDPREQLLARLREQIGPVEALAGSKAMLAACKGLLRLLDPWSGMISADEQRMAAGLDRESRGVGLEFHDRVGLGPLTVEAVHLGSPAQRGGVRPGDVITHLDGQPVARAPVEALVALRSQRVILAAPSVTPVEPAGPQAEAQPRPLRITYRRPGEKQDRTATLLSERFRPESVVGFRRRDDNAWNYLLDERNRLAVVRLTSLSRGTADDLRCVLEGLKELRVRGLVLDLRWCPGGYLNESIEVAELFLGTGIIVTERSRGGEDKVFRSAEAGKFRDFALVVLVNGETMGGGELIAAALQDHKRGVVVGQRTRGKGSVQEPLAVGIDGMALKLTRASLLRPSGKNLHRFADSAATDDWGVQPDEDCRVSPELSKRLREWHLLNALRPARSRERLPLDDPRADSQRRAAALVLRKCLERKVRAKGE
jgi:carboxyl-terminal processing protease